MKEISINEIIRSKRPALLKKFPAFFRKLIFNFIAVIIRQDEVNQYLKKYYDKTGFEFIDELFDDLDFSFQVSNKDKQKIPSEGKLLIVSNHPLGGLDGLVLLKLVSEIRRDVKIIVNDILLNIDNLRDLFLPYDINNKSFQKENLNLIGKALKKEEAVIIFPAGEVSRLGINGIRDGRWQKGVIHFSQKFDAPVLPVHISAKNSFLFYLVSLVNKEFSKYLLPNELFNKKSKVITVKIGHQIPGKVFSSYQQKSSHAVRMLKKHSYLLRKNSKGLFITEKNIIHPIDRKLLKAQLKKEDLIGVTNDGKKIFLTDIINSPDVVREIARLREVTFRKIGEGTGRKADSDKYDRSYQHLVLWDENDLEIVGAYRVGFCRYIVRKDSLSGLYSSTLFNYSGGLINRLNYSLELGRSFVQAKYWNTNALDYLWQGLGTILLNNPEIKYLFGAVSLSNAYLKETREMIVFFYKKWFSGSISLASAKNRFIISDKRAEELKNIFSIDDYDKEFIILKKMLRIYGYSVPTLFRQYSELCEQGGVEFLDFGIDTDFHNCVDALILVDVDKIKHTKKERYIYKHNLSNKVSFAETAELTNQKTYIENLCV